MQKLSAKSRRMTAHGANPPRENARVAAAMWGGADSFEQWPRDAGLPDLAAGRG